MKTIIIAILISLSCIIVKANTVVTIDKNGNYVSTSQVTSSKDSVTGKTFTTPDGKKYSVYVSQRGKLYIIRVSKKGNSYKQYLQVK